jgi:hypothetical protein
VLLLPSLDREDLYLRFHLDEPWNSAHNLSLLSEMPEVFRHRDSLVDSTSTRFQLITGPGTAFETVAGPSNRLLRKGGDSDRTAIAVVVPESQPFPGRSRAISATRDRSRCWR